MLPPGRFGTAKTHCGRLVAPVVEPYETIRDFVVIGATGR
jgi:hypothetical protein